MNVRSRSTLFLIEQLIVVAVFAICAAACVRIITSAYYAARDSRDVNNAIHAAESGAECFKAVAGDIVKTVSILGGEVGGAGDTEIAFVYYDSKWQVCAKTDADASYMMQLTGACTPLNNGSSLLVSGELSVTRLTGEELIAFPIAAISAG